MSTLLHTSGEDDKMVDALSVLKQRATADDPTTLFTLVSDLRKVGKEMGGEGQCLTTHMTTRVHTLPVGGISTVCGPTF